MTRYRTRSKLDDAVLVDGDIGWLGFETRRNAKLLEPNIAAMLKNFRLDDNVAKVRKGVDRITADLRTANNTQLTLPFDLGTFIAVSTLVSVGTAATCTTTALHGYVTGQTVEVLGANEGDYNGEFVIVVTSTTEFTYTMLADPAADTATGTITCAQHPVLVADQDGSFASCLFSDPETDKEYIAMARIDRVTLVDPDDITKNIDKLYAGIGDSGEEIDSSDVADMSQVNYGLVLFRGPLRAPLEWDGNVFNTNTEDVDSITRVTTLATITTDTDHQYHTGDNILMAGADQSEYNGTFEITITGGNTFTYLVAGSPATPATGTITSTKVPQFSAVADSRVSSFLNIPWASYGAYHTLARLVVPVENITMTLASLTLSGTTATATTSINHGLTISDRITISGANEDEYNGVIEITNTTATTFDYTITGTPATPATGTIKLKMAVRDQFIVSDVYDHRSYDPVSNLFRINRGKADHLVGFQNFQNDNFIALYRNSINLVTGMSQPDLAQSSVFQITDEVGCVARRTAVVVGDRLLFLSEQGIYNIQVTTEINLRGKDVPLSLDIEDEINSINWSAAENAVSIYFNNRYYIAVPSASSSRNDIIYVYSFLNKKWESKDTFAAEGSFVDNFVVCNKDGKKRLFATSVEGAVQLLEELDHDEIGPVGGPFVDTEIAGQLKTRKYDFDEFFDTKRISRGSVSTDESTNDSFTVTVNTQNPDESSLIATYTATGDEDYYRPFRIAKRGRAVDLQFDTLIGRPELRETNIEATGFYRSNKPLE